MDNEENFIYTDNDGDRLDAFQRSARRIERRMTACYCGSIFHEVEDSNGRVWYECDRGHKEVQND